MMGDDISMAFIFRVSQHSCICSCHDNLVKLPGDIIKKIEDKELKGEVNQKIRGENTMNLIMSAITMKLNYILKGFLINKYVMKHIASRLQKSIVPKITFSYF